MSYTKQERDQILKPGYESTVSMQRDGDEVVYTYETPGHRRVSASTARNDASVAVLPGEYRFRPVTIGGQSCSYDEAYYFVGGGLGELLAGGYPDQEAGDPMEWFGQPYGYAVRGALAGPQAAADAIAYCTGSARSYVTVTTGPAR